MADTRWIVVRNWDKHQHYKKRKPPWIKVYLALLYDPDFLALTAKQRGLLFDIWLLYAKHDHQVPASPAWLANQLGGVTEWEARKIRTAVQNGNDPGESLGERVVRGWRGDPLTLGEWVVRDRDLKALERRGWITFSDSKPLAPAYKSASTREVPKGTSERGRRLASKDAAGLSENRREEPSRDPDAVAKIRNAMNEIWH